MVVLVAIASWILIKVIKIANIHPTPLPFAFSTLQGIGSAILGNALSGSTHRSADSIDWAGRWSVSNTMTGFASKVSAGVTNWVRVTLIHLWITSRQASLTSTDFTIINSTFGPVLHPWIRLLLYVCIAITDLVYQVRLIWLLLKRIMSIDNRTDTTAICIYRLGAHTDSWFVLNL